MVLRNTDGTPYALTGSINRFAQAGQAKNLFNSYDREVIQAYGSPLYYYEVLIQVSNIDAVYLEDRSKLYSPNPVQIFGVYEPIEPQNPSTQFGIDGIGDVVFECNVQAVVQAIGHMPKRGSRIHTPHLGEDWIVVDTRLTQFAYWGALHVQIICERFQENATDASTTVPNGPQKYSIF